MHCIVVCHEAALAPLSILSSSVKGHYRLRQAPGCMQSERQRWVSMQCAACGQERTADRDMLLNIKLTNVDTIFVGQITVLYPFALSDSFDLTIDGDHAGSTQPSSDDQGGFETSCKLQCERKSVKQKKFSGLPLLPA
jgi:hypothetical protein